jgi:hypothetical protein
VRRPAWDELLADIAAGLINAVVCWAGLGWHVDRADPLPARA